MASCPRLRSWLGSGQLERSGKLGSWWRLVPPEVVATLVEPMLPSGPKHGKRIGKMAEGPSSLLVVADVGGVKDITASTSWFEAHVPARADEPFSVREKACDRSQVAMSWFPSSVCFEPLPLRPRMGWSDRRPAPLKLCLDRLPATSVAGFFPPPSALHRETKKPSPAAFHCVPALRVRGRSSPVCRPPSRPRWRGPISRRKP